MEDFVRIIVNVPLTHLDRVRLAIGDAGFGKLGDYDHCSFVTTGIGYFKPLDDANPTIGSVGEIEEVEEAKLEFACQKDEIDNALDVLKSAHPYEEIALDIIPLLRKPSIYNKRERE